MAVTIKDIARIVGVSHTTVSRALNNSPYISAKTKTKIREIAEKYGYYPNSNAKSLVLQKSFNIGLFFSTLNLGVTSNFFFEIVTTIQSIIKDNYKLIIRGIDDYKDDFYEINSRTFDGIIVVSQNREDDKLINSVLSKNIPVVMINRNIQDLDIDCFFSNEKEISREATEYLIDNGHNKIAFIKGKHGSFSTEERFSGFVDAMKNRSIRIDDHYIFSGDYSIESGYNTMQDILSLDNKPTAIFCSNDNMAIGAMRCLSENNFVVPGDFSVIGFDSTEFSKFLTPSLTSIRRPVRRIVEKGTKRLLEIIDKKGDKGYVHIPKKECLESEIILRESVE